MQTEKGQGIKLIDFGGSSFEQINREQNCFCAFLCMCIRSHVGHSKLLFFYRFHFFSSAEFSGAHTRFYCPPVVIIKHQSTTATGHVESGLYPG